MSNEAKKPLFTKKEKKKQGKSAPKTKSQTRWKIIIADDEPEVHDVTKLALQKFRFQDKGLTFLSAYSGREARHLVQEHPDVAVILVDVVMEEADAGLKLINAIRNELQNSLVRIILRTGHPGQAPVKEVMLAYDINDYKLKTELTAQRLFVTVVAALRSYHDLMLVEANRKNLTDTYVNLEREAAERKQVEEALRESESLIHLIIDTVLDAVITIDNRDIITGWNAQAHATFGWSQQEAIGQLLSDTIIPYQFREAHQRGIEHYMATGEGPILNKRIEITALHRDGHEFPVELAISPIVSGETVAFSAFIRDISERKQLQQQIQESLERRTRQVQTSTEIAQEIAAATALDELFRRVVNLVQTHFGYYHAHAYTLEENNLVMQEGTGDVGRQMKEAGHKIALAAEQSLVARAARSGEPVLIPDVLQEPGWLPNRLLPKTKSELAVPIKLGEEVLGVLDVQSDTIDGLSGEDQVLLLGSCGQIAVAIHNRRVEVEREQAQKELLRLGLVVEQSLEGVAIADMSGHIQFVNPAWARIHGYSVEELPGEHLSVFHTKKQLHDEVESFNRQVMLTGAHQGEVGHMRKDGSIFPTWMTVMLLKDAAGKPIGLSAAAQDITDRKRTEAELQERLNELGALHRATSREGWQALRQAAALPEGYLFDQIDVQPAGELWVPELEMAVEGKTLITTQSTSEEDQPGTTVAPLLIYDETIGALGVYDDPQNPLSPDEVALVESVSEQVALALEGARLFEQTQNALAQTEALYAGSNRIVRGGTVEEILVALVESTTIRRFDRASIMVFDKVWDELPPETVTTAAVWEREESLVRFPPGTRYELKQIPAMYIVERDKPTFVQDVTTDERVDNNMRDLFEHLGIRSVVVFPLIAGGQWFGLLTVQSGSLVELSEEQVRRINSLSNQAATVIQNRRLFAQTQAQAEQERKVRMITDKIQRGVDRDSILRIAQEEIRQMLSVSKSVAQIGTQEQLLSRLQNQSEQNGKNQDT